MSLTVALVGRPNVGKSTLFNRLVGQKIALVDDRPGVTRDRREAPAKLGDLDFILIDTAGLEDAADETLQGRMRAQTERAIIDADISVFMIDARVGITPDDEHFARLIRQGGKPVVLVANKAEGRAAESGLLEAYSLGFGEAVAVSAEHGVGLPDLYEAVVATLGEKAALYLPKEETDEDGEDEVAEGAGEETRTLKPIRVAIVGQPNAGKSTLINRMIGEERLLTGPEAGITRDSIAVDWTWRGRPFRLIDTAGMRRKAKVIDKLERLSVGDALRAIRFAEVVIIVIDATMPFEKQDLQIADLVAREGRALVLALNKWDEVRDPDALRRELQADLAETLVQVRGVPLIPISALTGSGIDQLLEGVSRIYETWNRRVATAALNRWLDHLIARHPPPAVAGRRLKIKYLTQSKTRPPTFFLACSRPEALPEAYKRYVVNGLREDFDLKGVPIRLMTRGAKNPYEGRGRKG
ncbi:ribosome biogenesis GTPase Der [Afifella sp. JA880]|uniref:ribosome biogenesis GTPase Der n=1 Tax=Afifella sp. JA880 TaxID=2975280 RepID=UPI0021BB036B|nr:ribosome biogenesis GTPase Der [Afifella sp. JA880]MCT8267579.1 ribosome biogenesis GTPase Der [Afifella sp. JA880]